MLGIVIVGIEPETHNETKEEKEEITDISGTETSTESNANKLNDNQAESIIESEDTKPVGNSNIETDAVDKLGPNSAAKSGNTWRIHD